MDKQFQAQDNVSIEVQNKEKIGSEKIFKIDLMGEIEKVVKSKNSSTKINLEKN